MNDATLLLRDMSSDTAQKAAGVLRPSEEQMAKIDEPAEENVWHEKPDMSKEAVRSKVKSRKAKGKDGTVDTDGTIATDGAPQQNGSTMPSEQEPAEAKKSREFAEKTKAFLAEKMPKERREQTIWRLKKMLVEIQGHSDCKLLSDP